MSIKIKINKGVKFKRKAFKSVYRDDLTHKIITSNEYKSDFIVNKVKTFQKLKLSKVCYHEAVSKRFHSIILKVSDSILLL